MERRASQAGTLGAPGQHVPKLDIKTRHKVISFGERVTGSKELEKLYCFRHQRADLKVTEGAIPIGFYSSMWLDDGHPLFLATRFGGYDEVTGRPLGPEYQVTWRKEKDIIAAGQTEGWNHSLDDLWSAALSFFERKNLLSESTLDYLDADPFVLFGIDNEVTQKALNKLEKCPALMCVGTSPTIAEWARYLYIATDDPGLSWLVHALAETELPKPWTCYKGVGCIVCYIRSDTGQVTWKHPFYDYFRQLRDFCMQASVEEVMQVRVNRLLWSYEATRVETEHYQEPLVSPEYVRKLSEIFGHDVREEGCLVRNLKAQLKVFAKTYREKQDIDIDDVIVCAETLKRDVEKYEEMRTEWALNHHEDVTFELQNLANGKIQCVNCSIVALTFCLECKDYLCLQCYDTLHRNGARRHHAPFRLVPCALCVTMPAKLHCTFTDKSLCHECYAMRHIKLLPPDGKENQPRQIDYKQQYVQYAKYARARQAGQLALPNMSFGDMDETYDSVLSTDWHPFYDSLGVKYYHNFATGERMRQSPRRVPNTDDPGAEEANGPRRGLPQIPELPAQDQTITGFLSGFSSSPARPLALEGFDSLKTEPKAAMVVPRSMAAEAEVFPHPGLVVEDQRVIRAPLRQHMPYETAAG